MKIAVVCRYSANLFLSPCLIVTSCIWEPKTPNSRVILVHQDFPCECCPKMVKAHRCATHTRLLSAETPDYSNSDRPRLSEAKTCWIFHPCTTFVGGCRRTKKRRIFYTCRLLLIDLQSQSSMHFALNICFKKESWTNLVTPRSVVRTLSCLNLSRQITSRLHLARLSYFPLKHLVKNPSFSLRPSSRLFPPEAQRTMRHVLIQTGHLLFL